jgi:hypothetical protein
VNLGGCSLPEEDFNSLSQEAQRALVGFQTQIGNFPRVNRCKVMEEAYADALDSMQKLGTIILEEQEEERLVYFVRYLGAFVAVVPGGMCIFANIARLKDVLRSPTTREFMAFLRKLGFVDNAGGLSHPLFGITSSGSNRLPA